MLLALLGCMGSFHGADGPEPVRSALWFDVNDLLGDTDPHVPRQALLLLLNSTLPCEAPAVDDDPATPTVDEAAAAIQFWDAQLSTAFVREGALAVALGLYTYEPDWEGDYDLDADAFLGATTLLSGTSRVGYGAWIRVDEAVVDEADGVYFTYTPTVWSFGASVPAPAWINVREHGTTLSGDFSFTPTELSGSFRADKCDNSSLLDVLRVQIVTLFYETAS